MDVEERRRSPRKPPRGHAASGTSATTSVTMDKAKAVTAVFARIALTVNKDGEGQVTVDPPNTTQTPSFTLYYPLTNPATVVSLTPNPAAGWGFKEWTGVKRGKEEDNPLSLTMAVDDSVRAVFAQAVLSVDKVGGGEVAVSPPGVFQALPFTGTFGYNSVVTLAAVPDSCWDFDHWEGDVLLSMQGTNPLALPMSGDMNVTAIFVAEPFDLEFNITRMGTAFKTVSPTPGHTSRVGVILGDTVTFRALAAPCNIWSGAASGTGLQQSVTFNSAGTPTVTVTRNSGASETATIVVTDVPPPTENDWVAAHLIDAATMLALDLENVARDWARMNFPRTTLLNGTGDAARHAYWNALITQELSAATAAGIATAHEHSGLIAGLPHNESVMDMHNNAIGRTLAAPTWAQMHANVLAAIANGTLWILDEVDNPSDRGLLINSDE